jgi:predicted porin
LGGSYTFANTFALSASYNRATSAAALWHGGAGGVPVYAARRYGFELGGSFFSGPFTITLDLTRDTKNDLYGNNKKYTNGVLEGKYSLSKRTFLYADYLRLDGDNNYGLGIRHNF